MTSHFELASDWWSRMHGPDAETHRPAFERWLGDDARNREAYAKLETAWADTAVAGETSFAQDRHLERHGPPFGLTVPRVAAMAAIAAALVLAVFLRPGAPPPVGQPVETAQQGQTGFGEIRTINLPDGSKVTLDTDSEIRVRFAADVRHVELLRGRARFEVRADPSRTFVVDAGDRQVTAPEGRFDAAILPTGVCVSAWRGSLDIRGRGAPVTSAVLFRLVPGQSFAFTPGLKTPPQDRSADIGTEQWPEGMLVFRSAPLSQVLADTNRYSRKRILLGDPSLGELRVTGTFRPLPVDALAASLAAAFELRVGADPQGNIVLQKP